MEMHRGRLGIASRILPMVMGLAAASFTFVAQAPTKDQKIEPQVILRKLFLPVYPPLARQALIVGDVHLKVSIRSDGSIDAVSAIDGSPVLRQAAVDSAKQSQFECKDCGQSDHPVERTFTYSFQVSPEEKPADSYCCLEEQAPGKVPTAQASQSDDRITITIPPECICSAEYLGTLMDRRMRLIAGNDALDCGRVKVSADPKGSLSCARQAISRKRAFLVRLDSVGMDSFLSDGFAGDGSGNVYSVAFDSFGWGPSPGIKILDNRHDAVGICPKPVDIWRQVSSKGAFMGYRCTRP
jgi:TonB family protein